MPFEHAQRCRDDGGGAAQPVGGAGYWAFALAVFYAVFVRFQQAAGLGIGLPGTIRDLHGFALASYTAGVEILLGGAVCLALVQPRLRVLPRWLPGVGGRSLPRSVVFVAGVLPALIAGAVAIAHALAGIVTKSLELAGAITIHSPASLFTGVNGVAMDWLDVLFYEPWFLLIGVTATLSALAWARDSGVQRTTIRRVAITFGLATLAIAAWALVSIVIGRILVVDLPV